MEITADMITQYGLMHKISTGNTFLDVILCLLVPLLLKNLLPIISDLPAKLWFGRSKEAKSYDRVIEHTHRSTYCWFDTDSEPPNSILQRAVLDQINKHMATLNELPEAHITLKKRPPSARRADGEGGEGSDGEEERTSEHDYTFNVAPPAGQWIDLKNGIRFLRETANLDDKQKNIKCVYTLSSRDKDGNERINTFIAEALEAYRSSQSCRVDPARYLYMPVLSGFRAPPAEGESGSTPSAMYKRYKLSEEKTFASLFHPDKDAMLRLVDQFLAKSGKFAIPGYPQKLGFLLYGPPGTGKTSLIKALAQYTRRSIISVPLSKISTNQELMDIVFDNKLALQNATDAAISLPFNKTIFVMEDVDAASTVVQRRAPEPSPMAHAAALLAQQAAAAKLAGAARGSASPDAASSRDGDEPADQDGSDTDGEGSGAAAGRRNRASRRCSRTPAAASTGTGGGASGWEAATGPVQGPSLPGKAAFGNGMSWFKGDDALNLAGLLNVLDGVVDTPDRIIIMTTNHPEKLDPALIRPGRINRKIYMGRLRLPAALSMVAHYFGPLAPADAAALTDAWRRAGGEEALSPADLEAMCAEYDTTGELVAAVEERLQRGAEGFGSCA